MAFLHLHPPHRLDLRGADVVDALVSVVAAPAEADARRDVEAAFGGDAFLSVRSALCALLTAQQGVWPAGSEILVSALTIKDIPLIIRAHGFVPVAVDVDPDTLQPSQLEIERRTTGATRAVIVAHLLGARADLDDVSAFAHARGLLVIEDCAQAFVGARFRGHADSDVVLFSFGTLKTCTALGGALALIRDDGLRARMKDIEAQWPAQPTFSFAQKAVKSIAFLIAQHPRVYGTLAALVALTGSSIGALVRKATRGFPADDVDELLRKLRVRPCAPLLRFMRRRLAAFDDARLARRTAAGEGLVAHWRGRSVVVGGSAAHRTHWLFAVRARAPAQLRASLAAAGVDASGASNLAAVGGAAASALVDEMVFVPAYPELGSAVLADIARIVDGADAVGSVGSVGSVGAASPALLLSSLKQA